MTRKKSTPVVELPGKASTAKRRPAVSAQATPGTQAAVETPEVSRLKHKLVRDSFTIPKTEYAVLDALKQRATRLQRPAKKGEILRAGIAALKGFSDTAFVAALNAVPSLKTGRPKGAEPTMASEAAQAPAKAPAKSPAKPAATSVAKAPTKAPTKAPAKAPTRAPEKTPVKTPAAGSAKAPMSAAKKPSSKAGARTA